MTNLKLEQAIKTYKSLENKKEQATQELRITETNFLQSLNIDAEYLEDIEDDDLFDKVGEQWDDYINTNEIYLNYNTIKSELNKLHKEILNTIYEMLPKEESETLKANIKNNYAQQMYVINNLNKFFAKCS